MSVALVLPAVAPSSGAAYAQPGTATPAPSTEAPRELTQTAPASLQAPPLDGQSRISLQLGLGAPLGEIGVGWAYALWEQWRLEGGLGLGLSGVQLSSMARMALGEGRDRFVIGAGLALGVLGNRDCPCYWLNADLAGYEHVFPGGFTFFAAIGATMPLRDASFEFWGRTRVPAFMPLPQVHLGLGSWLGGPDAPRASDTGVATARAPEAPRRHRLSVQSGLGDPGGVSLMSAAYLYAPLEYLRVEAALGLLGFMGNAWTQWQPSLMPTLAFGSARHRFVAGAGLAWLGMATRVSDGNSLLLAVEPAGYEVVFDGGFTLSVGVGLTYPLGGRTDQAEPGSPPVKLHITSPTARVALGWWL